MRSSSTPFGFVIIRLHIISTRIISWEAIRDMLLRMRPTTTPIGLRLFQTSKAVRRAFDERPRRGRRLDSDLARADEPEGRRLALPARPRRRRRDRGADPDPPPRRARAARPRPAAPGPREPARRPRRADRRGPRRPRPAARGRDRASTAGCAAGSRRRTSTRARASARSEPARRANVARPAEPRRLRCSGTSQIVASGGSVTSAENGCPCSGDASA